MEKDLIENGIKAKVELEKKSRGPMFLSNSYGKVQSRYLNVSTGSCHDLCKYGHKHGFDDERKHPVFRRFMSNGIVSDAVQDHTRDLNVGDGRKSSGFKLKASEKAKVLQHYMRPEGKEVGVSEIFCEISVKAPSKDHATAQSLLLEKKSIQLPLPTILQDSPVKVNQMNSLCSNEKKKKKQATTKSNASPVLESFSNNQNKLKASTENASGDDANIFKEKVASYMKETIASSALKVDRQKKITVVSRSSKSQNEKKNVSVLAKKIDGSAKPSVSLKARTPSLMSVTQFNGARNLKGSRNIRKIAEEKPKNEGMIINGKSFSKEGDGDASESCVSELSESEDVKRKQRRELLGEGDKIRVRRTPAVKPYDSSSLPYKMKFKRGRVIDVRPTDNFDPKRLRFRRGRVLNENSNGEVMKRIIRRKDKGNMKDPASLPHAKSSEARAVMLKHQDAEEKKNLRALFNHVIEETANKLVQTRKSKVKALVGAFETVISLQETKAAYVV